MAPSITIIQTYRLSFVHLNILALMSDGIALPHTQAAANKNRLQLLENENYK